MTYPLIVFEGIDGAGKSTQIQRVAEWLRSRSIPVLCQKEPTDGPYGARIRQLAKQHIRLPLEEEYALFLTDRRWNRDEVLLPAFARGEVVLLDRYYYSTAAYQGIRGLNPETVLAENEAFAPKPLICFIFELPVDVALQRILAARGEGTDAFEKRVDLEAIDRVFSSLQRPEIVRVNAAQSPEALYTEICQYLTDKLLSIRSETP
ncbi:MAG: dTMP kinase [Candidatus Sumerlaeia bacterium]|nr:dTMP kinase [Candidatus Sumerlaeia bacterium]